MAKVVDLLSLITPTLIIAVVSLIVSLISTTIAVVSFRRTRQIQAYDYATRRQVDEEVIGVGGPRSEDAFSYSAQLVNLGLKPIAIDSIYMDYGGETLDTSWHFYIEGSCYIPPSGKRRIKFSLSNKNYQAALEKFQVKRCLLQLRIRYFNMTSGIVEAQRRLMAIGPHEKTFYVQRGDALT